MNNMTNTIMKMEIIMLMPMLRMIFTARLLTRHVDRIGKTHLLPLDPHSEIRMSMVWIGIRWWIEPRVPHTSAKKRKNTNKEKPTQHTRHATMS